MTHLRRAALGLSFGLLMLGLIASGASAAPTTVAGSFPTFGANDNGTTYVPIPNVTLGRDSGSGAPCWVGTTATCGSGATVSGLTFTGSYLNVLDQNSAALLSAVGSATPAGTNLIGKVGIDQTTPGTTNAVQNIAGTSGGATAFHAQSAASNNAQLVGAAGAHTLYMISGVNPTTALACLHVYDNATSPTPGTTAIKHTFTLGAASSAGVGVGGGVWQIAVGEAYAAGLAISVTGGASNTCTDADTSSAPLGVSIEISYK